MNSVKNASAHAYWIILAAAITAGEGLYALHNSYCTQDMHKFVYAVTVTSWLQLALVLLGILMGLLGSCFDVIEPAAVRYNVVCFDLTALVGSLVSAAWLVWGITLLADKQCLATAYDTATIITVVFSGITVLSAVYRSLNK